MYSTEEISEIYNRNAETVYRICFMHTKNKHDAEDMTQNVFVRMMKSSVSFENTEHEKAWLIRTASNQCKDLFKSAWFKIMRFNERESRTHESTYIYTDETLVKVLTLPDKYKIPIYLHYYEGYKAVEIAVILKKPESTVRTYLMKGRQLLKQEIEKENNYEYKTKFKANL